MNNKEKTREYTALRATRARPSRAGSHHWVVSHGGAARNGSPGGAMTTKIDPRASLGSAAGGVSSSKRRGTLPSRRCRRPSTSLCSGGSRLLTDSASSSQAFTGYPHAYVNHTKKAYARGEVHENRAEG